MAAYLSPRLANFTTTIFAEMSALASATESINLGQGFPDTDGPREIAEWAVEAIRAGHNQYPPGPGILELRQAIAEHQAHWYGLAVDPEDEVLVTTGATEGIAASLLALCEPGDEVITFEPFYDSYAAAAAMAGAVLRVVTLRPPEWTFDRAELDRVFGRRSRLLLLNNPHNPTGKVFTGEELSAIAELCCRHDVLAVSDEVYEHLVFEGRHLPLAALDGMSDRCLTISSAGKMFSFTGWKIGWVCGAAGLVAAVRAAKQFLTYASGAPFQYAVAKGLRAGPRMLEGLARNLRSRRDLLCTGLADLGFEVFVPAGTYFATTDISPLGERDAMAFCLGLPRRCGVVAVPSSVFYAHPEEGRSFVRWAFCKRPEVLEDALSRLKALEP